VEGKSLGELLADLYRRVGEFHTRRQNIHLSPELEEGYGAKVANPPAEIAGKKVEKVITVDGVKLLFRDGSWVLFRKSGTEPVVRVYAEASSTAELERLIVAAADFVRS